MSNDNPGPGAQLRMTGAGDLSCGDDLIMPRTIDGGYCTNAPIYPDFPANLPLDFLDPLWVGDELTIAARVRYRSPSFRSGAFV